MYLWHILENGLCLDQIKAGQKILVQYSLNMLGQYQDNKFGEFKVATMREFLRHYRFEFRTLYLLWWRNGHLIFHKFPTIL